MKGFSILTGRVHAPFAAVSYSGVKPAKYSICCFETMKLPFRGLESCCSRWRDWRFIGRLMAPYETERVKDMSDFFGKIRFDLFITKYVANNVNRDINIGLLKNNIIHP